MKITIFSIGTQGDIRPLVALGAGLKKAGHQVRLTTDKNFQDLIESAGLEFAVLNSDFEEMMTKNSEKLKNSKNVFTILKVARKGLLNMAEQWVEQAQAASKNTDLLIATGMAIPIVTSLSEHLKIPFVMTHLQPLTPNREIPPIGLPMPRGKRPGLVNLAAHHFIRFMGWKIMRPAINEKFRQRLGLKPYPWFSPYYLPEIKRQPIIYGYSQHLIPRPNDWKTPVELAGFWFYDQASSWQPPEKLTQFLTEGPTPIYVGFGSMLTAHSEQLTANIIEAIRISGCRAILATGWGGISADQVSGMEEQICLINNAPHDWLFPRVKLAVHHGGAGTTAATIRAGIPSVVVPFLADQPFWAWSLKNLNVSPGYLELKNLTAQQLAHYIQLADTDEIKQNAAALGEKIRAEDGVQNAMLAMRRYGMLVD